MPDFIQAQQKSTPVSVTVSLNILPYNCCSLKVLIFFFFFHFLGFFSASHFQFQTISMESQEPAANYKALVSSSSTGLNFFFFFCNLYSQLMISSFGGMMSVDLVMWRDASKSAFVFGIGTFAIISSSYTKDLNIRLHLNL